MKRLISSLIALFTLGIPVAQAQDSVVISPQSIVVNPTPSFGVEVWVDRDSSGDSAPSYQIGETIRIGVRVSEAAYIYLFNVRSTGEIVQILPNRYDDAGRNNYLRAGETKYFPDDGAGYTFGIEGPRGLDKVIAVASKDQLDTGQLASFGNDPAFASSSQGEESFAQTLSIVVRPIPQNNWVTDTALFYVGSTPSVPVYGTLDIRSSPSGAAAYVDDQFVGYTPVRFGTTAGTHTVRLELSGYRGAEQQVNLQGGATQSVNLSLSGAQPPNPITVTLTSAPGAQVLSETLGLRLSGVNFIRLEQRRSEVQAELDTGHSLESLYDALNGQLLASGWRLVSFELKDRATMLEAEYRSGERRLDLELDRRGNSGRTTIEIDF